MFIKFRGTFQHICKVRCNRVIEQVRDDLQMPIQKLYTGVGNVIEVGQAGIVTTTVTKITNIYQRLTGLLNLLTKKFVRFFI